jgi:hypothetical protein
MGRTPYETSKQRPPPAAGVICHPAPSPRPLKQEPFQAPKGSAYRNVTSYICKPNKQHRHTPSFFQQKEACKMVPTISRIHLPVQRPAAVPRCALCLLVMALAIVEDVLWYVRPQRVWVKLRVQLRQLLNVHDLLALETKNIKECDWGASKRHSPRTASGHSAYCTQPARNMESAGARQALVLSMHDQGAASKNRGLSAAWRQ